MSSTVSILNIKGVEEKLVTIKGNLKNYIKDLGPCDAVAMETGIGCFYWANKIESRGAKCFIIDPYRFRINQGTPQQAAGYVIVWILNPIKLIGCFYIRPYNPYTSPDF